MANVPVAPTTLEGIISDRLALADCPFFPCYTAINDLKGKMTFGTVETAELTVAAGATKEADGLVRKGAARFKITLFLLPDKSITAALSQMDVLSGALRVKILALGREFQLEGCSFNQVALETQGGAEGVLKRVIFLDMPVKTGPKDDQMSFLPLTPPLNVTGALWLDPLKVSIAREKDRKNMVTVLGELVPVTTVAEVMRVSVEGFLSPVALSTAQEILDDLVKTAKAVANWSWQGIAVPKPQITGYSLIWEGLLIRCKLELISA